MKKIMLFSLSLLWHLAANSTTTGTMYDLNFRVTQNDNIIGGTFKVVVEIKGADGILTVGGVDGTQKGGVLMVVTHNMSSLQFNSGTIDPAFAALTNQAVSYNASKGQIALRARAKSDAEFYDIPTTWTAFATLTFDILSFDHSLGFIFASSRVSDNTTGNIMHTENDVQDDIYYDGASYHGGNGTACAPATDGSDECKPLIIADGTAVLIDVNPVEVRVDYFTILDTNKLIVSDNVAFFPWSRNAADFTITQRFYGSATFALSASSSGYGQYKGPSLPITYVQYWGTSTGWRNMAFPITGISDLDLGGPGANINLTGGTSANCTPSGGAWGNYVNTTNFYEFTAGTATPCNTINEHEYVGLTTTPVGGANGYYVFIGTPFFSTNGVVSASGTSVATTTYNYTQSAPHAGGTGSQAGQGAIITASWDGWRLIANPFTCAMDVVGWATDNGVGASSIKIFDRVANTLITAPTVIAPGQSFWFKNNSDAVLSFNIFDHGVISSAPVLTKTMDEGFDIVISSSNGTGAAKVIFGANASKGFDESADGFYRKEFFDKTPGIAFGVQNNNQIELVDLNVIQTGEECSFPIFLENMEGNAITLSLENTNLPAGTEVFLEDLELETGKLFDLNSSNYNTYSTASSKTGRFVVHINKTNISSENELNKLYAWFVNDELYLGGINVESVANIEVINMAGQVLAEADNLSEIAISNSGIYLVRITYEDGTVLSAKAHK